MFKQFFAKPEACLPPKLDQQLNFLKPFHCLNSNLGPLYNYKPVTTLIFYHQMHCKGQFNLHQVFLTQLSPWLQWQQVLHSCWLKWHTRCLHICPHNDNIFKGLFTADAPSQPFKITKFIPC